MRPERTTLESTVLKSGDATVYLAPARGGIATRFYVGERPVFYLDESTLLDPKKNVRGGNPVLFPSPGKLEGDQWKHGQEDLKMAQHGFARNLEWTVGEVEEDVAVLIATSNDTTMAAYPFPFRLRFRYALSGTTLRITQKIECEGPYGVGFHPYFFVPQDEKGRASITTPATRGWDNVTKQEIALSGPIDLTAKEVDLHLYDHGSASATLQLHDARIDVCGSEQFTRWVIWTVAGKDYVCLEPWTAPGNALNTGASLLTGHHELWTEISFSFSEA